MAGNRNSGRRTRETKPFIVNGVVFHPSVTIERIIDAVDREMTTLDNPGFCIACGEEADGCEPNARQYTCDWCGEKAVYGAAELLLYVG